jgi:hypothetical protein
VLVGPAGDHRCGACQRQWGRDRARPRASNRREGVPIGCCVLEVDDDAYWIFPEGSSQYEFATGIRTAMVCKGRLTMGEILFGLKHYWRFVDCEASETCIPSHRAGLLCHTPTSAKLAMISWLIVMFGEPGWSRGAARAHER